MRGDFKPVSELVGLFNNMTGRPDVIPATTTTDAVAGLAAYITTKLHGDILPPLHFRIIEELSEQGEADNTGSMRQIMLYYHHEVMTLSSYEMAVACVLYLRRCEGNTELVDGLSFYDVGGWVDIIAAAVKLIHQKDSNSTIPTNYRPWEGTSPSKKRITTFSTVEDIKQAEKGSVMLGEGTYGRVYRSDLGAYVVKEQNYPGHGPALREIAVMKAVNHPNVQRITAFGFLNTEDSVIRMPIATGDLGKIMGGIKTYPKSVRRRYAHEILAGLEALHHTGILHLDIKPGNILVMSDGRLVITDFGIADISLSLASSTHVAAMRTSRL